MEEHKKIQRLHPEVAQLLLKIHCESVFEKLELSEDNPDHFQATLRLKSSHLEGEDPNTKSESYRALYQTATNTGLIADKRNPRMKR